MCMEYQYEYTGTTAKPPRVLRGFFVTQGMAIGKYHSALTK